MKTFASGLPRAIVGIGGPMDVAFIGDTAYMLVTLVGSDVGGDDVVGIYRIDGPTSFTVVADIGEFSLRPRRTRRSSSRPVCITRWSRTWRVPRTDGHHNRVLRVTREGEVTEWIAFDNIVPTGLAVSGGRVYVAQAGPVPHLPADGRVVAVKAKSQTVTEIAAGAPLLVDVEFGRGHRLYALSQGYFPPGNAEGSPAEPHTGALVRARADGTFTVVADRRTSRRRSSSSVGAPTSSPSRQVETRWRHQPKRRDDEDDAGDRDSRMAASRRSPGYRHR